MSLANVAVLDEDAQIQAVADPRRRRILRELREPRSAAAVARAIGEPRQRVNHHVRELERTGLVRRAGERRNGNFIEQLFVTSAPTQIVTPRLLSNEPAHHEALADQASLAAVVQFGERLQRDAAVLLDKAAFHGASVPSASVVASVGFADAETRAGFLNEYLQLVDDLIQRYATSEGEQFTVGLAVYPMVSEDR